MSFHTPPTKRHEIRSPGRSSPARPDSEKRDAQTRSRDIAGLRSTDTQPTADGADAPSNRVC